MVPDKCFSRTSLRDCVVDTQKATKQKYNTFITKYYRTGNISERISGHNFGPSTIIIFVFADIIKFRAFTINEGLYYRKTATRAIGEEKTKR